MMRKPQTSSMTPAKAPREEKGSIFSPPMIPKIFCNP
jgi:hypothetical protein